MSETQLSHWHSVPTEFVHRLDDFDQSDIERTFNEIGIQRYIDGSIRYGADGMPDLRATIEACGIKIEYRPPIHMNGKLGSIPYPIDGWKIKINASQSDAEVDFTLGHELGHLMIIAMNNRRYGKLLTNIDDLPGAYERTEALCDYTSAKILGYIALK